MERDWTDAAGWPRERPPAWQRREPSPALEQKRWQREPEPYEVLSSAERYPGATAMEDLDESQEPAERTRILARYAVLRVLVLSGAGWMTGAPLRMERRIAIEHLMLLPAHDWERRALERLISLCRETPAPAVAAAASAAAEAAAKRGHCRGAFALYRASFDLARRRAWWAEAASAARGVGRLARMEEAHYSHKLWSRRARVLERRIGREHEPHRNVERDGERRDI
jgi:hypothetical protein